MLSSEKVNNFLKENKKRYKTTKLIKKETGAFIQTYYFKTNTNRHMIVRAEHEDIKSIFVQVDKWKGYTLGINGQHGKNIRLVY